MAGVEKTVFGKNRNTRLIRTVSKKGKILQFPGLVFVKSE
jgi:hypothetical protein